MYNRPFKATIDAVTPWVGDEEGERSHGLTLTATMEFTISSFLHDLSPARGYIEGINELLGGRLPIDGEIKLRFSPMGSSQLLFGPGLTLRTNCELTSIVYTPPVGRDAFAVRIKLKMRNLSEESYAVLCTSLREVVELQITVAQDDLFAGTGDGGDDAPPSVDEVTNERPFTPVPKPQKKAKKAQARPGRETPKRRGKRKGAKP